MRLKLKIDTVADFMEINLFLEAIIDISTKNPKRINGLIEIEYE